MTSPIDQRFPGGFGVKRNISVDIEYDTSALT
jgi:hypothetical protein